MVSEIEILAVQNARQAFWGTSDFSDAAYGEDPLPHWSLKNSEVLPDAKAYGVGRVIHPGV